MLSSLQSSNTPVSQVQLAQAYSAGGNYGGAIALLSDIKPEALTVDLVNILGDCLRRNGQEEEVNELTFTESIAFPISRLLPETVFFRKFLLNKYCITLSPGSSSIPDSCN